MAETHCPNCGAAISAENNGAFCKYCGGKLPKDEAPQITNTYNNVQNHYHTTTIYQTAPTEEPPPTKRKLRTGFLAATIFAAAVVCFVCLRFGWYIPMIILLIGIIISFVKNGFTKG
jgi:predicted amidophosphoribosyltransferase